MTEAILHEFSSWYSWVFLVCLWGTVEVPFRFGGECPSLEPWPGQEPHQSTLGLLSSPGLPIIGNQLQWGGYVCI